MVTHCLDFHLTDIVVTPRKGAEFNIFIVIMNTLSINNIFIVIMNTLTGTGSKPTSEAL